MARPTVLGHMTGKCFFNIGEMKNIENDTLIYGECNENIIFWLHLILGSNNLSVQTTDFPTHGNYMYPDCDFFLY